jgi:3-phosphoshikimate 1-carboxyvinyltransferase
VLGAACGFEVRGAAELRRKESDRIAAMVANLRAFGLQVEEWPDGYRVEPGAMTRGVARAFGDHRIAMTFAAAGFDVDDRECVRISFPEFFDVLRMLRRANG